MSPTLLFAISVMNQDNAAKPTDPNLHSPSRLDTRKIITTPIKTVPYINEGHQPVNNLYGKKLE
jgi:hypothetical protein